MASAPAEIDAFYQSAALGLAWLDAREHSPRRFGAAADATWRTYTGKDSALHELDRFELLLRDAATLHPHAFGPRAVFALPGLTDDEPFGPWSEAPKPGLARTLLRTPPDPGVSAQSLLEQAARNWALSLAADVALPSITPTTHVLCAGPRALIALASHFESRRAELDFAQQVVVVTARASIRQLAGLASLALGSPAAPRVASPDTAALDGAKRVDAHVVSADALEDERAACERWVAASSRR